MPAWVFIVIAVLAYGFWGFTMKMAVNSMTPMNIQLTIAYVYSALAPLFFLYLKTVEKKSPIVFHMTGVMWTITAVACGIVGSFATSLALEKTNRPAITNALVCVYPVVTYTLTVCFLNETLSLQSVAGVCIIIIGILLLGI